MGLLRIDDNKPVEWMAFSPQGAGIPALDAADLCAPTSTVACCIRDREIVVVDDIEKELKKRSKHDRRYLAIGSGKDFGSQLCLPIIHPVTRKIELVVTVYGNKANCLVERHSKLYDWILKHFIIRLTLEYSLLLLKGKANEPENKR